MVIGFSHFLSFFLPSSLVCSPLSLCCSWHSPPCWNMVGKSFFIFILIALSLHFSASRRHKFSVIDQTSETLLTRAFFCHCCKNNWRAAYTVTPAFNVICTDKKEQCGPDRHVGKSLKTPEKSSHFNIAIYERLFRIFNIFSTLMLKERQHKHDWQISIMYK